MVDAIETLFPASPKTIPTIHIQLHEIWWFLRAIINPHKYPIYCVRIRFSNTCWHTVNWVLSVLGCDVCCVLGRRFSAVSLRICVCMHINFGLLTRFTFLHVSTNGGNDDSGGGDSSIDGRLFVCSTKFSRGSCDGMRLTRFIHFLVWENCWCVCVCVEFFKCAYYKLNRNSCFNGLLTPVLFPNHT